jgi:intracellular proteinase inhibitor BsuPI
MRRATITLSALFAVLTFVSIAQPADMFPTNVNDSWSLQRFTQSASHLRVASISKTGWRRVEGLFDVDLWLYPQGRKMFVWDESQGASQVLYDFDASPGAQWSIDFGSSGYRLTGSVRVVAKGVTVSTAFGPLSGCTTFSFAWENLADTGVSQQSFCPGVGLVSQERSTFMGAEPEQTVARSVQGVIATGYAGHGMNVRLERAAATRGTTLKVQLALWDTTGARRTFRSASTQLFDVRMVDATGQVVRLWSSDTMFAQTATSWTLEGEKAFDLELPLTYSDGRPLNPGLYTVEGWILDSQPRPFARTQLVVN